MNKELKEVVDLLVVLNNSVNKQVLSESRLNALDNNLNKFDARLKALNKHMDTLLDLDLDFNDNNVINLLFSIHKNFNQLIICVDTVWNATGKMMCQYEVEWNKLNGIKNERLE